MDASTGNVDTAVILAEVLDKDGEAITGKHIKVNKALDENDIKTMKENNTLPMITFKACAVQSENIEYTEAVQIAIELLTTADTVNP